MADMILGSAQGTVDSLLGRLTSALAHEAQLLGGVRGDVQFIKDEMESMNGFLMHIAEATGDDLDKDHQVRAWMKQVTEVAYASQNCVDMYVQSIGAGAGGQGFLAFLQPLPQLLWTLPARHRIATQIQDLKVRAREVGERRLRYGVKVPPRSKVSKASVQQPVEDEEHKEQEDARRRALAEAEPVPFEVFSLVKWITEEAGDPLTSSVSGSGKTDNSSRDPLLHPVDGIQETQNPVRSPLPPLVDGSEKTQNPDGDPLPHPDDGRETTPGKDSVPCLDDDKEESDSSGEDPLPHLDDDKEELDSSGKDPLHRLDDDKEESDSSAEDPLPRLDDDKEESHSSGENHLHSFSEIKQTQNLDEDPLSKGQPLVEHPDGKKEEKGQATPRIIALVGTPFVRDIAKTTFEDPWVASSCSFDYKAWIQLDPDYPPSLSRLLWDILSKLDAPTDQLDGEDDCSDEQLVEKLQLNMKGKRFLLVLEDVIDTSLWDRIKPAFPDGNCSPGSALLVITESIEVAHSFSPYKVYRYWDRMLNSDSCEYLTNFYLDQAIALLSSNPKTKQLEPVLRAILRSLANQTDNCRLFLDGLYANPNQTLENFRCLLDNLDSYSSSKNKKQLLMFAYNGLSTNCKNCLLYLSIFPEDTTFERTRLVRRWAAESMIPKRGRLSAQDEADHCLNVLLAHRFVVPVDRNGTTKVKRFVMDHLTHRLVTKIASNENVFKINLLPAWAHRVPIRNTSQLQQAAQQLYATHSKACGNIFSRCSRSYQSEMDETGMFLESLPLAPQFGPLEMLDLENCWQVNERHLKNICNNLFQIKYLSLRKTYITKLPKQLEKLRYLETLDIRETKVKSFARNSIRLPKLKHLLAGHKGDHRSQQGSIQLEETFFTVQMPKHIWTMVELQVLSHVAVSGRDELIGIGSLSQLRKLGVVLNECQQPIFRHLYHAIEKLSKCLCSLSIRNTSHNRNATVDNGYITQDLYTAPEYLHTLKISGLEGLPQWIKNLEELSKLTLHETHLAVGDIRTLGSFTKLCFLRLGEKSCSESTLTFCMFKFQSLKFLIIECSHITDINFEFAAASSLKKIVWSSTGSQPLSLSGIQYLECLKELDLKGNFDLEEVNNAIANHQNKPSLKISNGDASDDGYSI